MRRPLPLSPLPLAPLLLIPLSLFTAGCGVLLPSAEDEAADAARAVAREAGQQLHSQRPRTVREVGYSASGYPEGHGRSCSAGARGPVGKKGWTRCRAGR
jgi:hypothetical protein